MKHTPNTDDLPEMFEFGNIRIHFGYHEAWKEGQAVHLTAWEFTLLRYFIEHSREVLTRKRILDDLWGKDTGVNPRAVDTHIKTLRQKLEDDPGKPRHFLTVHGVGYKFRLG